MKVDDRTREDDQCLAFKDDTSRRLSKDEEAHSCVFVENATLSINDCLVDVEQP